MPQVYKKSGGNAWTNKFKTGDEDKKPNFTGEMYVSADVLKDMISYAKSNTNPEDPENANKALAKLAVWSRKTKNGADYVYVALEAVPPVVDENPI